MRIAIEWLGILSLITGIVMTSGVLTSMAIYTAEHYSGNEAITGLEGLVRNEIAAKIMEEPSA
ncbi:hypothetical protein [Gracilibacillus suaedae]|uniref:hypothetical protein n=1 Tax=Gracilibacillus suaedae TaxID=2820273 RepID=UPI001ABE21BC|nr:hypothetical protein [Gracilibacillus suaedae]